MDKKNKDMMNILTNEHEKRANEWYSLHENHVNKLCQMTDKSFPPTLWEDKRDPRLWKPGHWKWFLDKKL